MPASSSSPTAAVFGQLADLAKDTVEDAPGLLALLARVADPRHRRGIRHRLAVILALAVCAVLAGARSFTAIAEWPPTPRRNPGQAGGGRAGALGVHVPADLAAPGCGHLR